MIGVGKLSKSVKLPVRSAAEGTRVPLGTASRPVAQALIGPEKVGFILLDRPSNRATKLIFFDLWHRGGKKVAGIQIVITEKFPNIAMEGIGSSSRHYHRLGAGVAPIFRIEIGGQSPKFLDGVGGREIQSRIARGVVIRTTRRRYRGSCSGDPRWCSSWGQIARLTAIQGPIRSVRRGLFPPSS